MATRRDANEAQRAAKRRLRQPRRLARRQISQQPKRQLWPEGRPEGCGRPAGWHRFALRRARPRLRAGLAWRVRCADRLNAELRSFAWSARAVVAAAAALAGGGGGSDFVCAGDMFHHRRQSLRRLLASRLVAAVVM